MFTLGQVKNINEINERLEDLVLNNLAETQRAYLIQFDQLDDNYTLYIDNKKYFDAIREVYGAMSQQQVDVINKRLKE